MLAIASISVAFMNGCSRGSSSAEERAQNFEMRVFELTNEERAKHNLQPFIWHDELAEVARAHSLDMMQNDFLRHRGSNNFSARERIEGVAGIIGARSWSENIAAGQATPEDVVRSWMDSPHYRANIFSFATHVGVGFVARIGDATHPTYWTQKFIGLGL